MTEATSSKGGRRSIGQFYGSGDWQDYWRTAISKAEGGSITVRGYPIGEIIESLSFVEMIYLVIRGELPTEQQAAGLDLVLRSSADQQFISSAVPPARFVASAAPEAPVAALASGVLAFGSVTGSPQDCAAMLLSARDSIRTEGLGREEVARRIVSGYTAAGARIPGLGHPMHKKEEPRAASVRKQSELLGLWAGHAAMLEAIRDEFTAQRTGIPINLAGAIACLLCELEFAPQEMGGLAVLGYLPALIAHTVEEIADGVPLRIIPNELGAKYVGPAERHLPKAYADRQGKGAAVTE